MGKEREVGILYEKYKELTLKYLMGMLEYKKEIAEDIMHDVWTQFLVHYETLEQRSEEEKKAWLLTVSKRMAINYLKKKSTTEVFLNEDLSECIFKNVEESIEERVVSTMLWKSAMSKLSEDDRSILVSRLEGISYSEVQKECGYTCHALECKYSRALKKFRQHLKKEGF